jgi:hypothetical protein
LLTAIGVLKAVVEQLKSAKLDIFIDMILYSVKVSTVFSYILTKSFVGYEI